MMLHCMQQCATCSGLSHNCKHGFSKLCLAIVLQMLECRISTGMIVIVVTKDFIQSSVCGWVYPRQFFSFFSCGI